MAFNEEMWRGIFESVLPVVSAVGHEIILRSAILSPTFAGPLERPRPEIITQDVFASGEFVAEVSGRCSGGSPPDPDKTLECRKSATPGARYPGVC